MAAAMNPTTSNVDLSLNSELNATPPHQEKLEHDENDVYGKKKIEELTNIIHHLQEELARKEGDLLKYRQTNFQYCKTPKRKIVSSTLFPNSTTLSVDDCPICLTSLGNLDRALFRTTCGHVFHFLCVKQCILTNQNGCPMCRKSFNDMTPPRTPLTGRNTNETFPGFVSARAVFQQQLQENPSFISTVRTPSGVDRQLLESINEIDLNSNSNLNHNVDHFHVNDDHSNVNDDHFHANDDQENFINFRTTLTDNSDVDHCNSNVHVQQHSNTTPRNNNDTNNNRIQNGSQLDIVQERRRLNFYEDVN